VFATLVSENKWKEVKSLQIIPSSKIGEAMTSPPKIMNSGNYTFKEYNFIKHKGYEVWRDFYGKWYHIRNGKTILKGFKLKKEAIEFITNNLKI